MRKPSTSQPHSRHVGMHRTPLVLAMALALGLTPLASPAATIAVTSGGDGFGSSSTCTLRQAIVSMNTASLSGTHCSNSGAAFGSNDTITFDTGTFTAGASNVIVLAGSQLEVDTSDLTIDATANGNITIDANQFSRVLINKAGNGDSLTLRHLTLRKGKATGNGQGSGDCGDYPSGGAICTLHAGLALENCTISGNSADENGGGIHTLNGDIHAKDSRIMNNSAKRGGGIYNSKGALVLTRSTVRSNSANVRGGGIFGSTGNMVLQDSTLSGNLATGDGGGIAIEYGELILTNSTASGNSAHRKGGAIYTYSGDITLTHSTVSGNSANQAGNGIYIYGGNGSHAVAWNSIVSGNSGGGDDIDGRNAGGGYNLIGNVPDLDLGPLADNGGATQTMLPQAGSAAIDVGDAAHCQSTDQRGIARPQGAACDIGAVEDTAIDLDRIFANGFD